MENKQNINIEELVNTLEPKEKRYISVYLSQYKSEKNVYLKLFTLLTHPSKKLHNEIELEDLSNNLSVLKVQLYWKILKGLQLFHSESNHEVKKNNLLSQFRIVANKGLTHQALKILEHAKELCEKHHFNEDLFYIYREELKLLIEKNNYDQGEDLLSSFNKQSLNNLKRIRQFNTLLKIYYQNKLTINFYRKTVDIEAIQVINSFVLKHSEEEILSVGALFLYHLNMGITMLLAGNENNAIEHFLKTFDILFENESSTNYFSINYSDILEITLECFVLEGNFNRFEKWLKKANSYFNNNPNKYLKFEAFSLEMQCQLYWRKNNLDTLLTTYKKYLEFSLKNKLNNYFECQLHIIRYYLGKGEFNNAFLSINDVFEEKNNSFKPEVQLALKLARLLLILFKEEFFELTTEITSTAYFFKKLNLKSNFYEDLIHILKISLKNERKNVLTKKIFQTFKLELNKILDSTDYAINFSKSINFKVFLK